jgi:hypothetical protein
LEKGVFYAVRAKKLSIGHLIPGGYKHGDLALQVEGVSNLRQ